MSHIPVPSADSLLLVGALDSPSCLSPLHTHTYMTAVTFSNRSSVTVLALSAGPDWYLNKVKLKIIDVNDNVPEWNMKPYPYLAVVSTEAPAGTFVYQLQAHDGDEGKSGEVEYFLSDGKLSSVHIHTRTHTLDV